MAIHKINTGTSANNGTGDSLRVGGQKINANFESIEKSLDSLQNTTARFAFDTLQKAKDKWASFSQAEKDELNGKTFMVSKGVDAGEYSFQSSEPDGVRFERKLEVVEIKEIGLNIYNPENQLIGRTFDSSTLLPVVSSSGEYDLSGWVPITPGETYIIRRSDGGYISSGVNIFDSNRENPRRVAGAPSAQLVKEVEFTAQESEYWMLTYTRYQGLLTPENINNLLLVEINNSEKDIEFTSGVKRVTGRELIKRNSAYIKEITNDEDSNGIIEGGFKNIYKGDNPLYNHTFSLAPYTLETNSSTYHVSEWTPITPGKKYRIRRSDGGGVSPSVMVLDENKEIVRRVTNIPTNDLQEQVEFIAQEGEVWVLTYIKLPDENSFEPSNINDLLIIEEEGVFDVFIDVNGDSTSGERIVELRRPQIEGIAKEATAPIIENALLDFDSGAIEPEIPAIPFMAIPQEISSNSTDAPVKRSWTAKEIITNVFETLRAENPEYISIIGDKEQADPNLPNPIIGMSDGEDSQPLYCYEFKPKGYEQTVSITASIHGMEEVATIAVCRILQMICREWDSHPQLAFLRHKVRLLVFPIMNPDGFDKNDRENANEVNLNRNWDYNWQSYDNHNYGNYDKNGSQEMNSELRFLLETIQPYLDEINVHIDVHTLPNMNPKEYKYWFEHSDDQLNAGLIKEVTKWLMQKNGHTYPDHVVYNRIQGGSTTDAFFDKVLTIPSLIVDFTEGATEWNDEKGGALAMTAAIEQVLNMLIAHTYSHFEPRKNLMIKREFNSRRLPSPLSNDMGHVHNANPEMIERIYDRMMAIDPSGVSKEVLTRSQDDKYDVLKYEINPDSTEGTVLIVGGLHTALNTTKIHYPLGGTGTGSEMKEFADGLRHVMTLPYLLGDLLKNYQGNEALEKLRKYRIVVIPLINPNDVFDATETINISDLFEAKEYDSSRPEVTALAEFVSSQTNLKSIVAFNEIDETDTDVLFKFSYNFPYEYKSGRLEVRDYIERILPNRNITASHTKAEINGAPQNSLINWASFNSGGIGVEINNKDIFSIPDTKFGTNSSAKVTELGNFLINILNRIV